MATFMKNNIGDVFKYSSKRRTCNNVVESFSFEYERKNIVTPYIGLTF